MLRPTKIRLYLSLMASKGFAAADVLEGSGIDAERLSDPGYLLHLRQCEHVVANMIRLTGNQAIGFDVGEAQNLSDFGIIGQAMLSSRTRRQATEYWIRYSNLVGMLIHISLFERDRGEWMVVFTATEPLGFIYNFCVEEILAAGVKLGGALSGTPLVPKEITLSYPAPIHAREYQERFACPVRFNSAHSSMTVSAPTLDEKLPAHDAELNEIYWRRCREVMRQMKSEDPLIARLRSLFTSRSTSWPDMKTAANLLGTSTRSLHRHLQADNTSYQDLLNHFRREQCLDYLRSGTFSNKEIAGLLGFQDANSLHRAFKQWTGLTIGAFRKSLPKET